MSSIPENSIPEQPIREAYFYRSAKASKTLRFKASLNRWYDLQEMICMRASELADDPLGATGYFTRSFTIRGSPESPMAVEEYSLDIQLLRELRVLEQEIVEIWNSGVNPTRLFNVSSLDWQHFMQRLSTILSPEQQREYEALKAEAAAKAIANTETISEDRNPLLESLGDRRNALQAAIRVRGVEFADDSAARTGYYSRKIKVRGRRERSVLVHEYSLDTQLVREIDAIDKQIAIAREEWRVSQPTPFDNPGGQYQDGDDPLFSLLTDRQFEIFCDMLHERYRSNDEVGTKVMEAYVKKVFDALDISAEAEGSSRSEAESGSQWETELDENNARRP